VNNTECHFKIKFEHTTVTPGENLSEERYGRCLHITQTPGRLE